MVKEEPVSLIRQTIYCLIPVLDGYAAYRVKRLRKYLVIMIVLIGIPISIVDSVMFPLDTVTSFESFLEFMTFYYGVDTNHFIFSIAVQIGAVLLAIFLIRHWSKQWNTKFE